MSYQLLKQLTLEKLRIRMADFGYESNDDYEFRIRSFIDRNNSYIYCLNVVGNSERRNTAFANALVQALNFKNIQYFDFTEQHPLQPGIAPPDIANEDGQKEIPLTPFDRTLAESCALSEGASTALIIDQLHHADFRHHIQLYDFIRSSEWDYPLGSAIANKSYLVLLLLSDEPLYHSLQKISYRVLAEPCDDELILYKPADFDLPHSAAPIFEALTLLFRKLSVTPTSSEFHQILTDLKCHIRHINDLKHSIFGWVERIDLKQLDDSEVHETLEHVIDANTRFLEFQGGENIELSS